MFWDGVISSEAQYWCCLLLTAVFGVCIGSFLNVCIWRMPRGESVVFAPSHCPKCNHLIRAWENIPILSFIVLRGRCSGCGGKISPRYWLVELLTGVIFSGIFVNAAAAGLGMWEIVPLLAVVPLAVAGAFIDIEHRIVPDALTWPTALIGGVLAGVWPDNWQMDSHVEAVLMAAVGWVAVYGLLWLAARGGRKLFGAEAFGGGDIKFVAAVTAVLGWYAGPFCLLIGALTGSVFGVVWAVVTRRKLRTVTIAFAPWLAVGVLTWCLWYPWIRPWLLP